MTSEFFKDDVTKKMRVAGLRPEIISRLFNVKEDSLVLVDESGTYYVPGGDDFEPPLLTDTRFEVEGISKDIPENTQQIVLPQTCHDVIAVQGANRDAIITGIIESCQNMNESANMLYHGPQAVFLVKSLAILSVCAPDPSLVTKAMPAERFKRLKTPESFRASLYQVASNMCEAFRQADYSMNTIRASLIDLPDYFEATLDVIDQTEDPKTKKVMNITIEKVEKASNKCKEAATNAQIAFSDVLLDINELCQASITTNTVNARELEEMKKLQKELELKEQEHKAELERQEEVYKEAKEQATAALKDYRRQIQKSASGSELFWASLTDGISEVVKNVVHIVSNVTSRIGEGSGTIQTTLNHNRNIGTNNAHNSQPFGLGIENGVLKTLETIYNNLGQIDNLNNDTIDEYIVTLTEYQKYSPVTEEGNQLFKKTAELKNFLEKNRKNLKDPALKKEIAQIRAGILAVVQTSEIKHQEPKQQVDTSLSGQLIKRDMERINNAREHYNRQSGKEEQLRKELSKNREELTSIVCKLQRIDMTKVELTDIIKYLREGIEYLGRVKEHWQQLSHFFDCIKIIIDNNFSESIEIFVKNAREDISRKLMLQSALKATCYCIQISNCATVYTAISRKYVMPVVSGIGKEFALTQREAIIKQSNMGTNLNRIMDEVKILIEEKREEYCERSENQINSYAERLVKAISGTSNKMLKDN